ncbi:MAG: hypothetical protein WCK58_08425 [Chloroflexota bacterium]
MSGRRPYTSSPQASSRVAGEARRSLSDPAPRRRGPHLGPVSLSPIRIMLLVALVGGLAFLLWSVLVRDQLQIPLMATGFAICGLVFAAMAVLTVISVIRAGHDGRDAAAVVTALFGGLIAMASLMCLAAATIFSLIWSGTKSG